jgi:hypothetical protein
MPSLGAYGTANARHELAEAGAKHERRCSGHCMPLLAGASPQSAARGRRRVCYTLQSIPHEVTHTHNSGGSVPQMSPGSYLSRKYAGLC